MQVQYRFSLQGFLGLFLDIVNPRAGENSALVCNAYDLVNPCSVEFLITGSLETTVAGNTV